MDGMHQALDKHITLEHQTLKQDMDAIKKLLELAMEIRDPIDKTVYISATQPLVIDYQERNKVYLFATVALTLSIEDLGTINLPANTWLDVSFPRGYRIFAVGQVTSVPVFVRATDDFMATNTINLAQVNGQTLSLGQKTMANSLPVTLASDQPAIAISGTVSNLPQTTTTLNGLQPFRLITAASNNATVVKSTPGNLYVYQITCTSAGAKYVKFVDKASAPTPGTDTVLFAVEFNGAANQDIAYPYPPPFHNGITFFTTTTQADSGAQAATAAGDFIIDLWWQ